MRAHPEWVPVADKGIPATVIARLNDVDPAYVRTYVRVRGEALRGGPAPVRQLLHDRTPTAGGGPDFRSWRRSWPNTSAAPTPRATRRTAARARNGPWPTG
jgi:hypothetical protein